MIDNDGDDDDNNDDDDDDEIDQALMAHDTKLSHVKDQKINIF
ncbi:unnamed protein product [Gongylonema pulchrum]|uniref:Uncharacterized protein n=1 Tax=Gongylonema pulchrum TaxID=637853 RepID=A0A183DD36_9BILA|nr:unnamed protein product [Gongylonema pulchrum]